MQLFLKTAAVLLLLVQYFHLAWLQEPTDPPRRTIDSSWYREKNKAGVLNDVTQWAVDYVQATGETNMESGTDYSSGIASDAMAYEPEETATMRDLTNQTFENTTTDETMQQPETAVPIPALPIDSNLTDTGTEFENSTTVETMTIPNTPTDHLNPRNHTELESESNTTQQSPVKPHTGLTNDNETTTAAAITTAAAKPPAPPSMFSTSRTWTPETEAPSSSEKTNISDKGSGEDSSERGVASDSPSSQRKGAWGAVLGTGVAVASVGLVAYIILKKKHHKAFSHRKLVEDFPSDPVLRLDNSEPLDLNFGGSAYYNPALQGDNIQMSNFPGRHKN